MTLFSIYLVLRFCNSNLKFCYFHFANVLEMFQYKTEPDYADLRHSQYTISLMGLYKYYFKFCKGKFSSEYFMEIFEKTSLSAKFPPYCCFPSYFQVSRGNNNTSKSCHFETFYLFVPGHIQNLSTNDYSKVLNTIWRNLQREQKSALHIFSLLTFWRLPVSQVSDCQESGKLTQSDSPRTTGRSLRLDFTVSVIHWNLTLSCPSSSIPSS